MHPYLVKHPRFANSARLLMGKFITEFTHLRCPVCKQRKDGDAGSCVSAWINVTGPIRKTFRAVFAVKGPATYAHRRCFDKWLVRQQ